MAVDLDVPVNETSRFVPLALVKCVCVVIVAAALDVTDGAWRFDAVTELAEVVASFGAVIEVLTEAPRFLVDAAIVFCVAADRLDTGVVFAFPLARICD